MAGVFACAARGHPQEHERTSPEEGAVGGECMVVWQGGRGWAFSYFVAFALFLS